MYWMIGLTIVALLIVTLFFTGRSVAIDRVVAAVSQAVGTDPFTVKRVLEIRSAGFESDGIHTLMGDVKITKDDYLLMGSDNSSTIRNNPGIPRDQLMEHRWWTGAPSLRMEDITSLNSHGTQGKDGVWYVDSFYSDIPRREYQSDPREVVWHAKRVTELRKQGMPPEERMATMRAEAKTKPWNN